MPYNLKTLLFMTLSSAFIVSCSNETVQVDDAVPSVEKTSEVLNKVVSEADRQTQAAKEQAMAAAEAKAVAAKEAALKAEAEAKLKAEKVAKEAEQRAQAEAQAIAAKKAAKEQAAKEQATKEAALAEAEAKRRLAEQEQAAALEAQRLQAQRLEAQRIEEQRLEAQRLENQRIKEAQAAAASQVDNTAVVNFQTPALQAGPNAEYNTFLSKYVSAVNGINLVAYDKVTPQDRAVLRSYIEKLSAMDIEALPRDAEMATWFNLYNAKTIELILENYPTKSIRKISSPWKRDRLVVNGKKMSLDDIEHGTVRKKYDEPRVHYAFNCASIGCPNIKSSAWEASSLEADLVQASRDFIGSERGVSIQGNKIIASSIFKWYKKDFGGNEAGILAHLRQYATGSKKAALDAASDINKYDYDWDLNIR